jgi:hypothetical protein
MKKGFILFSLFLILLSCKDNLIHIQNQLLPSKDLSQSEIDLIKEYISAFPNSLLSII